MAEVEVWRGGVAAWECDEMGHMNVGFYVAKAMEGLAGLAAELGMPRAFAATADATLMVREQHIRFLREARPPAPLVITAGVLEMGEADARLLLVMRHDGGEVAASFQVAVSHATAREGRAFPWPERIRARAAALATAVPTPLAPRSVGLEPVEVQARLDRALRLGLKRTGLGVVRPEDCDAFGRMRVEGFMTRLSDGAQHLTEVGRAALAGSGTNLGRAVLEYRLIHVAWPRAGERLELRSGPAGGDARFRRVIHWLLDPDSGEPWGSAEMIAVALDLDTRKIVTLTGEDAVAASRPLPGLTL